MSHTAAPWTVHHFVKDMERTQDAGIYEIEEANEEILELLESGDTKAAVEVADSNKALIEAVPDLLEVAQAVAEMYHLTDAPLGRKAQAAIAKAERRKGT